MSEKAYQPREYKTFASAKRAGRRECMRTGNVAFSVYRLWSNILVVGSDEQVKWDAYVNEHEIPIGRNDEYRVYVWQAQKKVEGQSNKGLQADVAVRPAEMIECGNCGVPRFVHGGVLEACPNCGDDETDLSTWDDVP